MTPFAIVSAPVMQPLTQSGSSQWRQETAKLTPSFSSILIFGLIFMSFSALAMSFSLVPAKAQ
jgi:hypothetical protein